jgi:uncharacterized cupredoxin-like copper-binding protein
MSRLSHFRTLLAASLLCAFAIPALAASPAVVNADLWNKPDGSQGVTLSTDHVKPGKVVINVKNTSTDEDHELLLVKTDSEPNAMPMDADGVRVDEDKLKGMKELGDVHPGKSRSKHAHAQGRQVPAVLQRGRPLQGGNVHDPHSRAVADGSTAPSSGAD